MRSKVLLWAAALALLVRADIGLSAEHADYVFRHGKVVTVDADFRIAQAIAVRGNRILAVGTDQEIAALIGPRTRVIDLAGRTLVPGLIDSHLHASMGAANEFAVSLRGVRSIADIQARIAQRVAQVKGGEWISASGDWHESQIEEGRLPTRHEIDAVAVNNPVIVPRGGHVAVANSRALALAGLDKNSVDPAGGVIVRDKEREPTGVLVEGPAVMLVRRFVPALTDAQRVRGLELYTAKLRAAGITAIVDPGATPADLAAYAELRRTGKLQLRVSTLLWARGLADVQTLAPTITSFNGDDWLRVAGYKTGVDGGIEAAYLHQPYEIVPGEQENPQFVGKFLLPPGGEDEFKRMLLQAARSRLQMQVHVVGDAAVDRLVAVLGEVDREISIAELRWVIVHAFLPTPDALKRIKELGLYVTVQDQPVAMGHNMVRYWGQERAARAIPIRSMLQAGIPVGGGTDAPIVDHSPFVSMGWMVTRATLPKGDVLGAQEAISREDALRAYTIGSARIKSMEDRIGSLEPRKLADLVVLSQDLLSVPPDDIRHIRSVLTMVDGKVIHDALAKPSG